uniref:Uncharacterized protein n=1 Tax=Glossina morsitans morsitans TaxID=37546 RepID=A0A1B0G5G0_GLOMM
MVTAWCTVCSEREQSKLGDTEGHYTVHNGNATDDPCIKPGPEGANYYFKWNHGKLSDGLERPTYDIFKKKYAKCFESVIVNKHGYYLWVPRNFDKKGKCVSPSGDYVWYHEQLPKNLVYPGNNRTLVSQIDLIPPADEEYTETTEPVMASPQQASVLGPEKITMVPIQEAGPMIIPAPQGPEAVNVAPIQGMCKLEAGSMIIPAPQGSEAVSVAPIQAASVLGPEKITTVPIQGMRKSEAEPLIIPAPQGPEAVNVAPIQGMCKLEAGSMIIPAPQGSEAVSVAPMQAPEVATTAPIQNSAFIRTGALLLSVPGDYERA